MTTTPIPAGWYPDPSGTLVQRWFDGASFTDRMRPLSTATTGPVARRPKSVAVAFGLAFLFGPLGLLYVSVPGALVTGVATVTAAATLGLVGYALVAVWCVVWACAAARRSWARVVTVD